MLIHFSTAWLEKSTSITFHNRLCRLFSEPTQSSFVIFLCLSARARNGLWSGHMKTFVCSTNTSISVYMTEDFLGSRSFLDLKTWKSSQRYPITNIVFSHDFCFLWDYSCLKKSTGLYVVSPVCPHHITFNAVGMSAKQVTSWYHLYSVMCDSPCQGFV